MKAKEYFAKYEDIMGIKEEIRVGSDEEKRGKLLMQDLIDEVDAIIALRHAETDGAIISILKEQNDKWNAICRISEKKYGGSLLLTNGFAHLWEKRIPELKGKLAPY